MGLAERVNELDGRIYDEYLKKNEIEKKLEPLYREKRWKKDKINTVLFEMAGKKVARFTFLKTIMIILMLVATAASIVLIYQNYPFEEYNMFSFICISIMHLFVSVIGICIACNAKVKAVEEVEE